MKARHAGLAFPLILASCSRNVHAPVPALARDNSYRDLRPGTLRIVVPLGNTPDNIKCQSAQGQPLTCMTVGPVGYEIARYTILAARGGRVRLKFESAATTRDGDTVSEPRAPELPFRLPKKAAYTRLIYMLRASESDHNMAIAAADRMDILDDITKRVRADPAACRTAPDVLCSWVPPHVAVRAE